MIFAYSQGKEWICTMIRTEIKQDKTGQLRWQAQEGWQRKRWESCEERQALNKQEIRLLEEEEIILLIWRISVPRKHFRPI